MTTVAAVFVMVIGAPLVVRALAVDSGRDAVSTQDTVEVSDAWPFEPAYSDAPDDTTAPRSDDPGGSGLQAVEQPDNEVASEADAPDVDTAPGSASDATDNAVPVDVASDRVADPPLDIAEFLTNPYTFDERSLRVAALQRALNIEVDGWYSPATREAHIAALQFVGLGTDEVPDVAPPGPSSEQWAALRDCESGGDYSIASSSGRYRGAYQFARTTWDNVAERHNPSLVGVDPATASPVEQDAMALALYREAGSGPWPVCGRHLR